MVNLVFHIHLRGVKVEISLLQPLTRLKVKGNVSLCKRFSFFFFAIYMLKSLIEFDHLKWSTTVSCMNSF